jgi:cytoskeletal protein RodZ
MSKVGFGEHLKREREMRGVSLDEICAATRISTRFLEALETEAWDRLPGGVFNRGFVRAVSRFLGLDEEGMVAEYVMAFNEQGTAPPSGVSQIPLKTTDWRPWIGAAMVLILVAVGWLGWRWHLSHRPPAVIAPLAAAASPASSSGSSSLPPVLPPAAASSPLLLKIEAGKATVVTVTADGSKIFDGSIIAGENRTFAAQNEFQVTARDAGALLLELNGRTLAPMGPPGRSAKVTLTRRDLNHDAGGSH